MHALIIEQDVWIGLMIEDILRELGYTSFHMAFSGADAVMFAASQNPDLITSALRLGDANGMDTVAAICRGGRIPVVFVTTTAWQLREEDEDLVVVQKPFGSHELKAAVERAVA